MSTFESELLTALGHPVVATLGGEHAKALANLQNLLLAPDSMRRRISLRILQRRATHYLKSETDVTGAAPVAIAGAIDWSAVPWEQIIMGLLKVLFMLLPFIL